MTYFIDNAELPKLWRSYLSVLKNSTFKQLTLPRARDLNRSTDPVVTPISASCNNISITKDHHYKYLELCGYKKHTQTQTISAEREQMVPSPYIQVLASPLHLQIISHPAFPFSPFGMIHVRNEIELIEPITTRDSLDILCTFNSVQTLPSGHEGQIVTTAFKQGRRVWHSDLTFLIRKNRARNAKPKRKKATEGVLDDEMLSSNASPLLTTSWELPSQLGWKYARISNDYNPIHLSKLTSRVFGFPSPIAHGMWTLARSSATLSELISSFTPHRMTIHFKRPAFLTNPVNFEAYSQDNEQRRKLAYHVYSDDPSRQTIAWGMIQSNDSST